MSETSADVQQLCYEFVYALAMACINPGFVFDPDFPSLPTVPVIMDQQDESTPSGRFIAIQGQPTVNPQGVPFVEVQDGTGERGIVQLYTANVAVWEVNGNGSLLNRIREHSYLDSVQVALDSLQDVTLLDTSPVTDTSYKLDNRWIAQGHMTVSVSVASRITETLSYIEKVETHEV